MMRNVKHKIWVLSVQFLVLAVAFGCNYQKRAEPTELILPTPNLTMTALFEPLLTQHASQTPVGGTPIVTPTLKPTEMKATQTIAPTVTKTETATSTATDTPVPTISYAGPGMRNGESVVAVYLKQLPKIDGYLGDWSATATKYELLYVVYGKENWKNENDLSGMVMFGWDNDYLFVGVRVKDDIYSQNQSGKKIYLGDSVELLLDVDVSDDYYLQSLNWDDFQLGVSPGNTGISLDPEAYLWYPSYLRGERDNVQIAQVRTDNGYHLEFAIPWSIFNISPYKGEHFGLAFSVSDNDTSGKAVQQSMISNVKNRSLLNPTTWGDLTLGE